MNKNTDEFPEEGELVICTVKNTFDNGAYVELDEYNNKKGYVPLKEISLRWIKNIHDYFKEGQKVVLKVIKVDTVRGQVDLSLRRVSDAERKEKLSRARKVQRGNKFLQFLSENLKISKENLEKIFENAYDGFLIDYIEEIAKDDKKAKNLNCDENLREKIVELIKKNIKIKKAKISGYLKLQSYNGDGINILKKILGKITANNVNIKYVSAPIYRIDVESDDYKKAEKILKDITNNLLIDAKAMKCEAEFFRDFKEANKNSNR